jgi:hypothetical protein
MATKSSIKSSDEISIDTPLSEDEFRDYQAREEVIARGLKTFEEVGEALLDIRDRRLYREGYPNFNRYCQERWGMSRRHADRLIIASDVAEDLRPFGLTMANEAQARELAHLPPQIRPVAWKMAVDTWETDNPPSAHVRSTVNVFKIAMHTGAIDDGEGNGISVDDASSDHYKAAITEETAERLMRQKEYVRNSLSGTYPQCVFETMATMTLDGLIYEKPLDLKLGQKVRVKMYELIEETKDR